MPGLQKNVESEEGTGRDPIAVNAEEPTEEKGVAPWEGGDGLATIDISKELR
jgi:hypothetical protein